MKVQVRFDVSGWTKGLEQLRKRAPSAIQRALRRAGVSARQIMAEAISRDTDLTYKYVWHEIKIAEGREFVTVSVVGARMPLIAFSARGPEPSRGKGRGVSYRGPGGRGRIPNAFIARMPNAGPSDKWHKGVFIRVGTSSRKSRGAWSNNLPIAERRGPSLPHVFAKYLPLGEEHGRVALLKNLQSELRFAMGGTE